MKSLRSRSRCVTLRCNVRTEDNAGVMHSVTLSYAIGLGVTPATSPDHCRASVRSRKRYRQRCPRVSAPARRYEQPRRATSQKVGETSHRYTRTQQSMRRARARSTVARRRVRGRTCGIYGDEHGKARSRCHCERGRVQGLPVRAERSEPWTRLLQSASARLRAVARFAI